MEIGGFGSEGVVALGSLWIIKDLVVPFVKKVVIPWWAKKVLKKPNPNPSATQQLTVGNPNSLTLAKVVQALQSHEQMDEKRTDKLETKLDKLRDLLAKHGERLAGLESHPR